MIGFLKHFVGNCERKISANILFVWIVFFFFFFFYRPAILFVHGMLDWDKFHMMISRSTTPDLLKMAAKLEEFFIMYLTNSKRVLSAFGPIGGSIKSKSSTKRKNSEDLGKCLYSFFFSYFQSIHYCFVFKFVKSRQNVTLVLILLAGIIICWLHPQQISKTLPINKNGPDFRINLQFWLFCKLNL